jgi:hypothetical protein
MKYFITLLLLSVFVFAEDTNKLKADNKVIDHASDDFAKCSAFYYLIIMPVKGSNESDLKNKYADTGVDALSNAIKFAKSYKNKEIARKELADIVSIYVSSMMTEIEYNFEKKSILMDKYLLFCNEIMKNPEEHYTKTLKKQV